MGRRSKTGGVIDKGGFCQVDFAINGVRHRVLTGDRFTTASHRRWVERLARIKEDIRNERFRWEEEFPLFRDLEKVSPRHKKTYNAASDSWEKTVKRPSFAWSTEYSYKRINKA